MDLDNVHDAALNVTEMRLDDAIFWSSYLADAECSLKKDRTGRDVIWIKPK